MEGKTVHSMYNLSFCMNWPISTNTQAFSKTLVFKFCYSEPLKVLVDGQINTFFRSIKVIAVMFHVKCNQNSTFQEIHLFSDKRYHLKLFNIFKANNNINSTLKLKRKLDWSLELIYVVYMYKWNPGIFSRFLQTSLSSNPKSPFIMKFEVYSCFSLCKK